MSDDVDTGVLLGRLLDDYPPGTALLRYADGQGRRFIWAIGAHGTETRADMEKHLSRYKPDARLIEFAVLPIAKRARAIGV